MRPNAGFLVVIGVLAVGLGVEACGGSEGGTGGGASASGAGGATTTTSTACDTPSSPGSIAIGGSPTTPTLTLISGDPAPTCAAPHPAPGPCCPSRSADLQLTPEQQTVGIHQLDPSACTRAWKSYWHACDGWGSQSGTCGTDALTIEVLGIDDTQITWREMATGAWGPEVTAPRCP